MSDLFDTTVAQGPASPVADDPVEDTPESAPATSGDGEAGTITVPPFMRQVMEASGVDVAAVEQVVNAGDPIFPDAQAVFEQAARATGQFRCESCKRRVQPDDGNALHEVIGWSKPRTQGGQNHVIDRAETGRVMCGECGIRLLSGLDPKQGSLL